MDNFHSRYDSTGNLSFPSVRSDGDGLLSMSVDDEVVVYDLDRHKASCLNASAAEVWHMCDGMTSTHMMASRIAASHNVPFDEAEMIVWYTLARLEDSHLLNTGKQVATTQRLSRRELGRRLKGIGIALALPVVYSLAAPNSVAAQSVRCGQVCHISQGIFCPSGCVCDKRRGKLFVM